jgi:anti-sigma factor RsiW
MLSTQLEFEITQLLDGDLPPQKEAILRRELAADPEAVRLMEEYARLEELLSGIDPPPEVDWDALHGRISRAVGGAPAEANHTRRPWGQVALAASVLIALGVGMLILQPRPAAQQGVAIVQVSGIEFPAANTQAIAQINIGPAPGTEGVGSFYDNEEQSGPPRVVIATGRQPTQDSMLVALAE